MNHKVMIKFINLIKDDIRTHTTHMTKRVNFLNVQNYHNIICLDMRFNFRHKISVPTLLLIVLVYCYGKVYREINQVFTHELWFRNRCKNRNIDRLFMVKSRFFFTFGDGPRSYGSHMNYFYYSHYFFWPLGGCYHIILSLGLRHLYHYFYYY